MIEVELASFTVAALGAIVLIGIVVSVSGLVRL